MVIEAGSFEEITTADITAFIGGAVQSRGLAPKTANRYREILCRLFNWAMEQHGIRMPNDKNPAAKVQRSVTDRRRSLIARPWPSSSCGRPVITRR